MRWDNKKKKYVRADATDKKKIKTESGVWIPASYKSNRYAKWKERSKLAQMQACNAHDLSPELYGGSVNHKYTFIVLGRVDSDS